MISSDWGACSFDVAQSSKSRTASFSSSVCVALAGLVSPAQILMAEISAAGIRNCARSRASSLPLKCSSFSCLAALKFLQRVILFIDNTRLLSYQGWRRRRSGQFPHNREGQRGSKVERALVCWGDGSGGRGGDFRVNAASAVRGSLLPSIDCCPQCLLCEFICDLLVTPPKPSSCACEAGLPFVRPEFPVSLDPL